MNPIDDQLNRLFRSAAQTKSDGAAMPPYGMETRVLAAWRTAPSLNLWDTALLVRGVILAMLIMGISFLPLMNKTVDPFTEYLQLADSTTQVDAAP